MRIAEPSSSSRSLTAGAAFTNSGESAARPVAGAAGATRGVAGGAAAPAPALAETCGPPTCVARSCAADARQLVSPRAEIGARSATSGPCSGTTTDTGWRPACADGDRTCEKGESNCAHRRPPSRCRPLLTRFVPARRPALVTAWANAYIATTGAPLWRPIPAASVAL